MAADADTIWHLARGRVPSANCVVLTVPMTPKPWLAVFQIAVKT